MAKLLQGSARVLTPTNLITNSDFEFNGGYPNPYTYNGTTNGTINFEQDLQLICYGGVTTVKNVTFTRSEGVLRITGMVQGFRSDSHIRINDNDEFLRKNRYYTLGASMKDNLGTVQSFQCYFQNDANVIYNTVLYPKGDTTNWYKPQMIEGTTVNGQQNVRLAVIYFGVTNGFIPFDVSIKEPYIYEGTYINPPFFESLDVKTQGWAMRRDMTNMNRAWYKKVLSLSAGTHWVGIVGHVFGSKFLLSIGESDDDLITTNNSEASTHEIYEVTSNYALFNSTKNYRNSLLKVESISVLESTVANNIVQSFSYRTTTSKSVITAVQVKTTKKYLVMSILPLWSEYGNPWQTGLIYNFFGTNQDSSTSVVSANAGQTVVPSYTNLVIKP